MSEVPLFVAQAGRGLAAVAKQLSEDRVTSLIRNSAPLGPYCRTMPRDL